MRAGTGPGRGGRPMKEEQDGNEEGRQEGEGEEGRDLPQSPPRCRCGSMGTADWRAALLAARRRTGRLVRRSEAPLMNSCKRPWLHYATRSEEASTPFRAVDARALMQTAMAAPARSEEASALHGASRRRQDLSQWRDPGSVARCHAQGLTSVAHAATATLLRAEPPIPR